MRHPQREPMAGMPERVRIYEVGVRDGLQNEKTTVPVEVKAEFVRRLLAAGLETIEVTSFVSPKWVPQLADAADLIMLLGDEGLGRHRPVLTPNEKGLERALALGVSAVAIFGSATETFSQKNLNRSVAESVEMFRPVAARAKDAGAWVRAYVSMCFGDPWEGDVPVAKVVDSAKRFMDLGADELSLGDTIGVATPGHVVRLLDALVVAGIPMERIAVHFHDTYGQALTNTVEAVRHGVRTIDTSAGGLGVAPMRSPPPATSPLRTWSGRWRGWACRPASTSTRWWRPASGWRSNSAVPPRAAWSEPSRVDPVRALSEGAASVGFTVRTTRRQHAIRYRPRRDGHHDPPAGRPLRSHQRRLDGDRDDATRPWPFRVVRHLA